MTESKKSRYEEAGVNIDKGNELVNSIKKMVSKTHTPPVLNNIGGFSALFDLNKAGQYEQPILVSSTDGVGTKLNVAQLCQRHDTIGIDLVAMCVNDIIVSGAKPLFFLDYFATSRLDVTLASAVVAGISEGCKIADCALIGGETAEMPGLYQNDDYDLAGFVVGVVDKSKIIDGTTIQSGDKIIGLSSSGLHSNGFSLARKVFFEELQWHSNDFIPELQTTLGEALLAPTRIYVKSVLEVMKHHNIKGIVHNTGGGFIENIPRILPEHSKAIINPDTWQIPNIFKILQEKGNISSFEMYRTFNMGIGLLMVVADHECEAIMKKLQALGEDPHCIGTIADCKRDQDHITISGIELT